MLERDPSKRATITWLKNDKWLGMRKKMKYKMTAKQKEKIEVSETEASGSITFGRVVRSFTKKISNATRGQLPCQIFPLREQATNRLAFSRGCSACVVEGGTAFKLPYENNCWCYYFIYHKSMDCTIVV